MKQKKSIQQLRKEVPFNYGVCIHADCPQASACLRHDAFVALCSRCDYMRLINPTRCTTDGRCPFHASNRPVLFARGFTNFQQKMLPRQYKKFMKALTLHFGRTNYYDRRRGDRLLPPEEQEVILKALERAGVTEKMTFDDYEEGVLW